MTNEELAKMPELIDRQELIADYRICGGCSAFENCSGHITMCDSARIRQAINEAPTIEPEVRHGRWILCEDQHGVDNDNNNYAYFCSQCHHQDVHSKYAKVNFCWNCGADMREGGADNG